MQPGPDAERCDECGGYFEPLSRRATQIAMGPWYIRDKRVPFRPGCSYEVLVSQIKAGRIKPNTVIRGPTTRQFWSVARNVPGVAHLLGYCHRCGAHVSPNDKACPDCAEPFMAVTERNELGLLYPTAKEAAAAQRALQREVSGEEPEPAAAGTGAEQPASPGDEATGGDLVEQVLGLRATGSPGQQAAPSTAAPPRQGPAPGQVGQLAATGIASGGGPQGAGSSILDFRQGGGAATAGGGGGGGGGSGRQLPGAGHGLDFAPSDAEEEQTAPSGQSAATWILALINVLALIAVLVLVILFLRGQQGDEATQAEAPQGSGIAYNTNTDQDRGEEAEDDPAERRGAPSPAQEQSQAAERTTEPAPDAGPSDGQGTEADTHDSASDEFAPQPPPAPQAPATPQVPVDPPSSPAPESPTPAGDDLFGDSHDRTEAPGEAESPSRQPPRQQAPNNTPTFFGVPLDGDDQADPGDEDATEPVEDDRSGTSDN